ncbi:hypothetical protein TNCV_1322571 [Trichonephila clavipes]|nr:hypothetical protein TNCV_1322571 [Trichonephila clavipes]
MNATPRSSYGSSYSSHADTWILSNGIQQILYHTGILNHSWTTLTMSITCVPYLSVGDDSSNDCDNTVLQCCGTTKALVNSAIKRQMMTFPTMDFYANLNLCDDP